MAALASAIFLKKESNKKMKTLGKVLIGIVLMGLAALFSHVVFADGVNSKQDMGALKQAALELNAANPKLSESLLAYYEKEKKEVAEWGDLNEVDKKAELAYEENGIKILEQAAKELKKTNPSLAEKIIHYADQEKMEISEK